LQLQALDSALLPLSTPFLVRKTLNPYILLNPGERRSKLRPR
jgi:hypothetical protein